MNANSSLLGSLNVKDGSSMHPICGPQRQCGQIKGEVEAVHNGDIFERDGECDQHVHVEAGVSAGPAAGGFDVTEAGLTL